MSKSDLMTVKQKRELEIIEVRKKKLLEQERLIKQKIAAKERKMRGDERARETRQKIIIGAAILGDADYINLVEEIKQKLTRDHDRDAFGLPPLQK